ncbi:hypothetical protein GCM10018793_05550 [Streptomyces sulfonofaciens]|uniref:Uncharacterized protein n=1 Tax=Streptomyces sulfonofaciens TaxID=68272 RepID=A0A919FR39_9ACTN|nr:DUF6650 family protein [Streptomyces sulfonofaciens]GHH70851.1 hypothetical protein GCM10018793_05550 [Streptomyces sulfonofaciens]
MRVMEVMRRIKGFSTPLGGVDWELPPPQRAVAEKVVVYLEDRRVLTVRRVGMVAVEDRENCVASVLEIRATLTRILMEPDTGDQLAENLKAMRAACRRFLDTVGPDHTGGARSHMLSATFGAALGELRAVFGIQLGIIAARHHVDLPEELTAILPASDTDDE